MFFLAVNIIKKNCVIGKQGFSLFPFFVLGIVPIFANDNYTLTHSDPFGPKPLFSMVSRVCHFLKHIETKISLFCKVFLAFFTLLLYNIFVGTTVFAGRISCLLKPFRIMGKNI